MNSSFGLTTQAWPRRYFDSFWDLRDSSHGFFFMLLFFVPVESVGRGPTKSSSWSSMMLSDSRLAGIKVEMTLDLPSDETGKR